MPDHVANQGRQKAGLELLKASMPGFYVPVGKEKEQLLELLGVSKAFKQTFDAIRLHVGAFSQIRSAKDFDLIEIKNTDKHLSDLQHGLFFGMTENEEMLLKVLEGKYFLCFVSLHPESKKFALVSWTELKQFTQNRRIQYQINLKLKARVAKMKE